MEPTAWKYENTLLKFTKELVHNIVENLFGYTGYYIGMADMSGNQETYNDIFSDVNKVEFYAKETASDIEPLYLIYANSDENYALCFTSDIDNLYMDYVNRSPISIKINDNKDLTLYIEFEPYALRYKPIFLKRTKVEDTSIPTLPADTSTKNKFTTSDWGLNIDYNGQMNNLYRYYIMFTYKLPLEDMTGTRVGLLKTNTDKFTALLLVYTHIELSFKFYMEDPYNVIYLLNLSSSFRVGIAHEELYSIENLLSKESNFYIPSPNLDIIYENSYILHNKIHDPIYLQLIIVDNNNKIYFLKGHLSRTFTILDTISEIIYFKPIPNY